MGPLGAYTYSNSKNFSQVKPLALGFSDRSSHNILSIFEARDNCSTGSFFVIVVLSCFQTILDSDAHHALLIVPKQAPILTEIESLREKMVAAAAKQVSRLRLLLSSSAFCAK